MFRTVIRIAGSWVAASDNIPRAHARRLARAYREGLMSPNVTAAKVVRVESK